MQATELRSIISGGSNTVMAVICDGGKNNWKNVSIFFWKMCVGWGFREGCDVVCLGSVS